MLLSKNQVVRQRRTIEKSYDSTCSVFIQEKVKKTNGSTGLEEKKVIENEPCRLSYSTISQAKENNMVASVNQTIKLFIKPDVEIKSGSKIEIKQNNKSTTFVSSGESNVYITHQEIMLTLEKENA